MWGEATGEPPLWPCGCVMGDPGCCCGQPEATEERDELDGA